MTNLEFALESGHRLSVETSDYPGHGNAKLVCGINKAGSTLFHQLTRDLCLADETIFIDIPKTVFRLGLTPEQWEVDEGLNASLEYDAVLGGFRFLPRYIKDSPKLSGLTKGLLVRDPRDAMVSQYYSAMLMHNLPESGDLKERMEKFREERKHMSIDEFVRDRAKNFKTRYQTYLTDVNFMNGAKIWRYEDIIFDKPSWIEEICNLYEFDVDKQTKVEFAEKYDVIPATEDTSRLIRKVVPKQHREKLLPSTIEILNDIFSEELAQLGYA